METLVQNAKIAQGIYPIDATGAALDGDYVSMKNYEHLTIIVSLGVLTDTDAVTVALKQATAVAGTSEKALSFSAYWKSDASGDTFTKTTVSNDAFTFAHTDDSTILVIEVRASELDVANGFDCVRLDLTSPGAHACLVSCLYVLTGARFGGANIPSAIVD